MSALLAFLAPILVGFAVVAALLRSPGATAAERWLRATTALAIGAALASTSHAAILFFGGSPDAARSTAKDMAFAAVAAVAAAALWRGRRGVPGAPPPPAKPTARVPALALVAAAVACAATVAVIVLRTRGTPDGDWDASGIWNLRARFLLRGGGDADVVFSKETFHADYPLLVPGLTATGWLYAGEAARWVPAGEGLFWAAILVGATAAAACRLAGARAACLGVLLLLGAPSVAKVASWQYADVPTAAFLLLSVAWLALAFREPPRAAGPRLALAGLCVSLAAWTKNEGLAQALALSIAVAAFPPVGLARGKALLSFAAGAAAFLAIAVGFKAGIGARNDLLEKSDPAGLLSRVLDPGRYGVIASAFAQEVFRTSAWNLLFTLALLAPLCLRPEGSPRERRAVAAALSLVGLGYAGVYVLTPHDLAWHLDSSLHRLLLHVYPSLVLATVVWRGQPRWAGRLRT